MCHWTLWLPLLIPALIIQPLHHFTSKMDSCQLTLHAQTIRRAFTLNPTARRGEKVSALYTLPFVRACKVHSHRQSDLRGTRSSWGRGRTASGVMRRVYTDRQTDWTRRCHHLIPTVIFPQPAFHSSEYPSDKRIRRRDKTLSQRHYSRLAPTHFPLFRCIFHSDNVFNYVLYAVNVKQLLMMFTPVHSQ